MTVGRIITEGLLIHEPNLSAKERDRRAQEALREVGMDPAMRNRYPHEFPVASASASPLRAQ